MKTILLAMFGGIIGLAATCSIIDVSSARQLKTLDKCTHRSIIAQGRSVGVFDCNIY